MFALFMLGNCGCGAASAKLVCPMAISPIKGAIILVVTRLRSHIQLFILFGLKPFFLQSCVEMTSTIGVIFDRCCGVRRSSLTVHNWKYTFRLELLTIH